MEDSKDLTCVICGAGGLKMLGSHKDRRKHLAGSWIVYECKECGLIAIYPSPSETELSEYYSAYSQDKSVGFSLRAGSRYPVLRKLFHWLSGDVDPRDFIEPNTGARVLDYGCGYAGYLSDFHERGVAISGAEIASHVVEACRNNGYDVHKVDNWDRIPFDDGEYDIIYLMQVFEHLRDPHGFMKELARILKGGGMLYLAVPNADSIWRKVFGNNWVSGWFAPFHLFHYNRDTLAKLAAQHGFGVAEMWSSTPESWFRLNVKACVYPKENQLECRRSWLDSRPMNFLLMLMLRIVELPFGERDCLVVKLQKRG